MVGSGPPHSHTPRAAPPPPTDTIRAGSGPPRSRTPGSRTCRAVPPPQTLLEPHHAVVEQRLDPVHHVVSLVGWTPSPPPPTDTTRTSPCSGRAAVGSGPPCSHTPRAAPPPPPQTLLELVPVHHVVAHLEVALVGRSPPPTDTIRTSPCGGRAAFGSGPPRSHTPRAAPPPPPHRHY